MEVHSFLSLGKTRRDNMNFSMTKERQEESDVIETMLQMLKEAAQPAVEEAEAEEDLQGLKAMLKKKKPQSKPNKLEFDKIMFIMEYLLQIN